MILARGIRVSGDESSPRISPDTVAMVILMEILGFGETATRTPVSAGIINTAGTGGADDRFNPVTSSPIASVSTKTGKDI